VTVIPEEFTDEPITVDRVCTILEGAILKRRAMGRPDGLIVLAEGLGEKMDPDELAGMPGVEVEYDSYGHLRLAEIPLETILRREVQRRFAARGESVPITDLRVGYELRCAPPVPFDVDYTRTLGYGAARFLLAEQVSEPLRLGGMVTLSHSGHLSVRPFEEFRDPETGRTAVRLVEIDSEDYRVARQYMLRLERRDLEDPEMLEKLASEAKMSPDEFTAHFSDALNGYSEE
jgi:6-phosphofructokinase 1